MSRAGLLRELSFLDSRLAGRGCTSEAPFVRYLWVSQDPSRENRTHENDTTAVLNRQG
jgi:hypothetical protein